MNVPAYHIGVLKGYLSGQDAPTEVFVAAEALYMAAIQGPLRVDAIEAINLVAQAAERLAANVKHEPTTPVVVAASVEPPTKKVSAKDAEQSEIVLPVLTRRALEMASKKDGEAVAQAAVEDDFVKVEKFIKTKGITRCPPLGAAGSGNEAIAGTEQPKKRKEWSPEAREAAAERMRVRQAAKRSLNGHA